MGDKNADALLWAVFEVLSGIQEELAGIRKVMEAKQAKRPKSFRWDELRLTQSKLIWKLANDIEMGIIWSDGVEGAVGPACDVSGEYRDTYKKS